MTPTLISFLSDVRKKFSFLMINKILFQDSLDSFLKCMFEKLQTHHLAGWRIIGTLARVEYFAGDLPNQNQFGFTFVSEFGTGLH